MSHNESTTRVFGYKAARELTQDEIAQVSGGTGSPPPSFSGPRGVEFQDDVSTDPF